MTRRYYRLRVPDPDNTPPPWLTDPKVSGT